MLGKPVAQRGLSGNKQKDPSEIFNEGIYVNCRKKLFARIYVHM